MKLYGITNNVGLQEISLICGRDFVTSWVLLEGIEVKNKKLLVLALKCYINTWNENGDYYICC